MDVVWPPRDDRALWRWIGIGCALPLLAWAIGASFWVHGGGVAPFRATNPLSWMVGQPLLAAVLYLGRTWPFHVALVVQAAIGLVLIATLLQAPVAYLNVDQPGSGLEGFTYLRLLPATLLAVATGMVFVGQAAYVLRLSLSRRSIADSPQRAGSGQGRLRE